MSARVELHRHLRIHGDHDLSLVGHDGVPLLDLLRDPLLERLADDSGADVHNPLLWDFGQVWLIRQVPFHQRSANGKLQNLLER